MRAGTHRDGSEGFRTRTVEEVIAMLGPLEGSMPVLVEFVNRDEAVLLGKVDDGHVEVGNAEKSTAFILTANGWNPDVILKHRASSAELMLAAMGLPPNGAQLARDKDPLPAEKAARHVAGEKIGWAQVHDLERNGIAFVYNEELVRRCAAEGLARKVLVECRAVLKLADEAPHAFDTAQANVVFRRIAQALALLDPEAPPASEGAIS